MLSNKYAARTYPQNETDSPHPNLSPTCVCQARIVSTEGFTPQHCAQNCAQWPLACISLQVRAERRNR